MEKLRKIMSKIFHVWGIIGLAAIIFMMGLVVVDVILRTFFKTGIVGATELAQMMLIGCLPLGAICLLEGRDIKMDILIDKLPKLSGEIIITITYVLEAFILFVLCAQTFAGSVYQKTYMTTFSMLGIPQYPFFYLLGACYGLCGVSVVVLVLLQIKKIIDICKAKKQEGGALDE